MNTHTASTIGHRDESTVGSDADEPGSSGEPARSDAGSNRSIEVLNASDEDSGRSNADLNWLRERLIQSAQHLKRPVVRLTVLVMGDSAMADLHARHGGPAEATDVLTFPMNETACEAGPRPSGDLRSGVNSIDADIAICADVAARSAAARGHDINRELLLYALHGLLHCAGFDDRDEAGYLAMHAEEDRILRAIGVGAVFSGGPDGDAAL
jgi:probable rRNA maturation factor